MLDRTKALDEFQLRMLLRNLLKFVPSTLRAPPEKHCESLAVGLGDLLIIGGFDMSTASEESRNWIKQRRDELWKFIEENVNAA